MRHVLIIGSSGQLGQALSALAWPEGITLHRPPRSELDLSSENSISIFLYRNRYDLIINCAAFTDVEKSEVDRQYAFQLNAAAPRHVAKLAQAADTPLIHISTDYVFDGNSSRAYSEDSPTNPLNTYGISKLQGEIEVQKAHPGALIVRTSWLMSALPGNFLTTMLGLAQTQSSIPVVDDQIGSPTSAYDLASALQVIAHRLMKRSTKASGVYHFANAGVASRADLAEEIIACMSVAGGPNAKVERIQSASFATLARRPKFSVLDTTKLQHDYGIFSPPWQSAVEKIITTFIDLEQKL